MVVYTRIQKEGRREGEKARHKEGMEERRGERKQRRRAREKERTNKYLCLFLFVCLFVFVSNVLLYILLFHIYIFSDVCDYVANRKLMTCLLYQIRRLERGKAAIMQTQAQFE